MDRKKIILLLKIKLNCLNQHRRNCYAAKEKNRRNQAWTKSWMKCLNQWLNLWTATTGKFWKWKKIKKIDKTDFCKNWRRRKKKCQIFLFLFFESSQWKIISSFSFIKLFMIVLFVICLSFPIVLVLSNVPQYNTTNILLFFSYSYFFFYHTLFTVL